MMQTRIERLFASLALAAVGAACSDEPAPAPSASNVASAEFSQAKRDALAKSISAFDALEAGRFDEALRLYDEVLAVEPTNFKAKVNRSVCLTQLKRTADALVATEECVQLAPSDVDARMNRAALLLDLERAADALPHVDVALSLAGAHPKPLMLKALILAKLGRGDEALAIMDSLPQNDAWQNVIRTNRAKVLGMLGRVIEADAIWQQLLEQFPQDAGLRAAFEARPGG